MQCTLMTLSKSELETVRTSFAFLVVITRSTGSTARFTHLCGKIKIMAIIARADTVLKSGSSLAPSTLVFGGALQTASTTRDALVAFYCFLFATL